LLQASQNESEGRFSVGLDVSHTRMTGLQHGTHDISQSSAKYQYDMRPTKMTSSQLDVNASYAFTPAYELILTLPWVRNTMTMAHYMSDHTICGPLGYYIEQYQRNGIRHKMDAVEGIGDLTVEGSIRMLDEGSPETGSHRIFLRPGLKLPTGEYKAKARIDSDNGRETIPYWDLINHVMPRQTPYADPCMQPGTGSWDPIIQLHYLYRQERFGTTLTGGYQLTTRNSLGYEYGDSVWVGVFPSYSLLDWLRITTGLRYRHIEKSQDHGGRYTDKTSASQDPSNSGGDLVDAVLSLDCSPIDNLTLSLGTSIPVWTDLNGIQQKHGNLYTAGVSLRF
jgi:hypothetical protein